MADISPFRMGVDDLEDADSKFKKAVEPIIDNLNDTLGQLVPAVNGILPRQIIRITLQTTLNAVDTFPVTFRTTIANPQVVEMVNCIPKDVSHIQTAAFVRQTWDINAAGLVSIRYITGLQPLNTYTLVFCIS